MNDLHYRRLYGLVLCLLVAIYIWSYLAGFERQQHLIREHGPIESLSALGYLLCFGVLMLRGGWGYMRRKPWFAVLPLALGLREIGWHSAFTTMSIFKRNFYLEAQVPLVEKIIGGGISLVLAYLLLRMIRCDGPALLRGLRERQAAAQGAALAIVMAIVAKMLDGSKRKFADLGVDIASVLEYQFTAVEEILELGLPIVLFIAFHAGLSRAEGAAVH